MKLSELSGFSSRIEINKYAKSLQGTSKSVSSELLTSIKTKFNKAKWQTVIATENGFEFFGKKKRDLGCDSLSIKVIGSKYVIHTRRYSNSNSTDTSYYKIN